MLNIASEACVFYTVVLKEVSADKIFFKVTIMFVITI